ncbi:MAG: hypothetical protein AB7D00_08475 [Rhodospirillaceae bacterium]
MRLKSDGVNFWPDRWCDWSAFLWRVACDEAYERLGVVPPDQRLLATRYLCHRSLPQHCPGNGGLPYVMWGRDGRDLMAPQRYLGLRPGETAWVRPFDLLRFAREVLPRLEGPVVLFTSQSDRSVPGDCAEGADAVAASGKVLRWFSTNFDGTAHADLIEGIPIGLPYARRYDLHFGPLTPAYKTHPAPFEAAMERLLAEMRPACERPTLAFADFHLNDTAANRKFGETRTDIRNRLAGNPCVVFAEQTMPVLDLMKAYARHAFVVSPHGKGLDCYRTWEALLMGAIVIVKRSPLDALYAGLPVAIVSDWGEVTPANLQAWQESLGGGERREAVLRALSAGYWLDRFRRAQVG